MQGWVTGEGYDSKQHMTGVGCVFLPVEIKHLLFFLFNHLRKVTFSTVVVFHWRCFSVGVKLASAQRAKLLFYVRGLCFASFDLSSLQQYVWADDFMKWNEGCPNSGL